MILMVSVLEFIRVLYLYFQLLFLSTLLFLCGGQFKYLTRGRFLDNYTATLGILRINCVFRRKLKMYFENNLTFNK